MGFVDFFTQMSSDLRTSRLPSYGAKQIIVSARRGGGRGEADGRVGNSGPAIQSAAGQLDSSTQHSGPPRQRI